jgi:hypothetical protein
MACGHDFTSRKAPGAIGAVVTGGPRGGRALPWKATGTAKRVRVVGGIWLGVRALAAASMERLELIAVPRPGVEDLSPYARFRKGCPS